MTRCVRDLMDPDVPAVHEGTSAIEVARRLWACGIDALPVIDADRRVIGVVSEADLILKDESPVARRWPLERRGTRDIRRRMHAATAAALMSAPASVIGPEVDIADLARFMRERRLKFVPVCRADGRLLGAITRLDLVREFLRGDREIAEEVRRILEFDMSLPELHGEVIDGVVTLDGTVDRPSQIPVIVERVRRVPGTVDVVNGLRAIRGGEPPLVRPGPWAPFGGGRVQWQGV